MKRRGVEIVVGIFVLAGVACLVYVSLVLGQVGWFGSKEYDLYANFDNVEGLLFGATVEIAGVQVGRVRGIELDEDHARVTLAIKAKYELDNEVICSVRTKGVIGEKFLRLEPGGGEKKLKNGDTITETVSGVDIMDLVGQFVHGDV